MLRLVFTMVFQQIKLLLLGLVGLFRRAICCFSRRRKMSYSNSELQSIQIESVPMRREHQPQTFERDWNSWDDSPKTVEEHIERYRQRMNKPATPEKEEPEPDFFSDLTPNIKPQTKYYLGGDKTEKTDFSRLEAKTDVPMVLNADLEDWVDEDEDGGWEEHDTQLTKQMIREKRKELRNQRQRGIKSNGINNQTPNKFVATRVDSTHHDPRNHT